MGIGYLGAPSLDPVDDSWGGLTNPSEALRMVEILDVLAGSILVLLFVAVCIAATWAWRESWNRW